MAIRIKYNGKSPEDAWFRARCLLPCPNKACSARIQFNAYDVEEHKIVSCRNCGASIQLQPKT